MLLFFKSLRNTLILALFAAPAWAQITLNSTDVFQTGDTRPIVFADSTGVTPGDSGPNRTWDYSDLVAIDTDTYTFEFAAPGATPYGASFPSANLAEIQEDMDGVLSYVYWNVDSAQAEIVGIVGGDDIEIPYSDPQRVITFPFTYNSSQTDTFASTFTVEGTTVNRTGDIETEGDAYGTVITPAGTFNNALRLKISQNIRDVVSVQGLTVETETETDTYSWHIEGIRFPVLSITMVDVKINGISQGITATAVEYADLNGTGNGNDEAHDRWLPHVTRLAGGFESNIHIHNRSSQMQTVTLRAYDNAGEVLNEQDIDLAGNELFIASQTTVFPGIEPSHFSIGGSESCRVSVGYRAASGNAATAHLHESPAIGPEFWVYQGERSLVFDGVALVNPGDNPIDVTATMFDQDGGQIAQAILVNDLQPKAKFLSVFEGLFPDRQDAIIRITASEPVAVIMLRGTYVGADPAFLFANLPVQEDAADRWVPHVTRLAGGFETNIHIHNRSSQMQTVTLRAYDSAGMVLGDQSIDLAGNELFIASQTTVFPGSEPSHFAISGSASCRVSVGYRAASGNAATAHLHEDGAIGPEFWVYQGERSLVFDGVALVNPGDSPVDVTATMFDQNGTQIAQAILANDLQPKAKFLSVFEGLLPDRQDAIIRITASQPVAVILLRGTYVGADPAFLFANVPVQ